MGFETLIHLYFTGVCIDTSSSLGMCAKRNSVSAIFTNA